MMSFAQVVFLGGCHAYAGLLTNSSMAATTASLTHLVKMSEPLYTVLILVTIGRLKFRGLSSY